MKKLTYAIALSSLLLAGCSQDEGIMESKGELVTLNYNVSLGNGVQSRAGEDLAVNKLLCVIFEKGVNQESTEIRRDIVDIQDSNSIIYTPTLFNNAEYRIVFWAYHVENGDSCFNLENMKSIMINDKYDKGSFEDNKNKDAFTAFHDVKLEKVNQTPKITLNRPFGMVNVYTSKDDYEAAVRIGSTPTSGSLYLNDYSMKYNAYEQKWNEDTDGPILLNTKVSTDQIVTFDNKECYCLASEYVFGGNNVLATRVTIKNDKDKEIYNSGEITNMPLGQNARTNLYNPNLLTGGGVTYTITFNQGFIDDDDYNKEIN